MGIPMTWTEEQRKWALDRLVMHKNLDPRGPVDVVLRLLEQGEITRSKAREAIREIVAHAKEPALPVDKLNWAQGEPGKGGAGG